MEYIISSYNHLLPVSMQEVSRHVARLTYQFWKSRGWTKIKIDRIKSKKVVWRKKEKKLWK